MIYCGILVAEKLHGAHNLCVSPTAKHSNAVLQWGVLFLPHIEMEGPVLHTGDTAVDRAFEVLVLGRCSQIQRVASALCESTSKWMCPMSRKDMTTAGPNTITLQSGFLSLRSKGFKENVNEIV